MIPILYKPNETNFTTNGIGRLSDAISCLVTEERNSLYELEMQYPMEGLHFEDIENGCYIKCVPFVEGEPQLFIVYEISKQINGRCTIYAAHVSYRLSLIPSAPFSAESIADCMFKLKSSAMEYCPFSFWTNKKSDKAYYLRFPASIRGKLQGNQWSILQNYKPAEIEWDNWTVRIWENRGQDKGFELRYGKNIVDLRQEENIRTTYTGVVPYWYGFANPEDEEETLMMLPEKVLYTDYVRNYPYHRTGCLDLTEYFTEEQPTEEQLRSRARRYINENDIGVPRVNIRVSFVDLKETEEYKDIAILEQVNLCDTVYVRFDALGVSVKAKVVKTVYNVLLDRYDSIQVGNYTSNGIAGIIADTESFETIPDLT